MPGDRQHHEEDQPERPRDEPGELLEVGRAPRSRDSDGRTTTPSGTPIRPIGIWSSVNATLNAVTEPVPIVEASDGQRRRT